MLSVADAKKQLLSNLVPVDIVEDNLEQSMGRVLAELVVAEMDSPSFTNSSMDGFAVKAKDISGISKEIPATLSIVGDIPAGIVPEEMLKSGEAMRIMTGAYLPEGADTVVPVEETNFNFRQGVVELPSTVEVFRAVEPGEYVRVQGEDFKKGQVLIKPGVRLRPQDMGILAMMGKSKVKVYRKPRVAVISTGDELLPVESEIVPGKIRETNSYTLSALIESCGGEPVRLGMVPDEQKKVNAVLDEAVNQGVDLILTSAGVSVGAYDFVKQVVEENGELNFWRVNMRPGKPLAFGSYKDIPYVGLPGNPVSSFAGFEVFLRPTLHFLGGVKDWERITLVAALAEDLTSDGRESYLRARLEMHGDKMVASLTGHQGSGNLHSLVLANGLIIVPAGVKFLPSGSTVTAWLLN